MEPAMTGTSQPLPEGVFPPAHANGANGTQADELQQLLQALQAMRTGDFTVRLPGHQTGVIGKIADTFNDIVAANERMADQLERVGQTVGREGKTRQRVKLGIQSGAWAAMESSVNTLIQARLWRNAVET